jgi:hypothetical protein
MNALEANTLITKIAHIDPRVKRRNPEEQAQMADTWASLLPDVSLADALDAAFVHYRRSAEVLMPSHILNKVTPSSRGYGAIHPPAPYGKQWAVDALDAY